MLPTVSAMRCAWQQLTHGDMHVLGIDAVVDARFERRTKRGNKIAGSDIILSSCYQ
jgi:hypothetical protein